MLGISWSPVIIHNSIISPQDEIVSGSGALFSTYSDYNFADYTQLQKKQLLHRIMNFTCFCCRSDDLCRGGRIDSRSTADIVQQTSFCSFWCHEWIYHYDDFGCGIRINKKNIYDISNRAANLYRDPIFLVSYIIMKWMVSYINNSFFYVYFLWSSEQARW